MAAVKQSIIDTIILSYASQQPSHVSAVYDGAAGTLYMTVSETAYTQEFEYVGTSELEFKQLLHDSAAIIIQKWQTDNTDYRLAIGRQALFEAVTE